MPKRGGSKPMDPLKAAIAKAVQDFILPVSVIEQMKRSPELGVTDVEIQVINSTETIIRVKIGNHSVRYFHNKLKEMM